MNRLTDTLPYDCKNYQWINNKRKVLFFIGYVYHIMLRVKYSELLEVNYSYVGTKLQSWAIEVVCIIRMVGDDGTFDLRAFCV